MIDVKYLIGQILVWAVLFVCSVPLWIHPLLTFKSWWQYRHERTHD